MLYKLFFIGVAFFTGTIAYGDPVAGVLLTPFGWLVGKAIELNHLLRRQLSSPALVRTVAQKREHAFAETQRASSDEESSQHSEKFETQQNHEELIEQVAEAVARKMAGRFLSQDDLTALRQLLDEAKALRAELLFQQTANRNDNHKSKYLH